MLRLPQLPINVSAQIATLRASPKMYGYPQGSRAANKQHLAARAPFRINSAGSGFLHRLCCHTPSRVCAVARDRESWHLSR